MKISLNWLKEYVKVPEGVSDDDLIRLIGARLVEVEGVIDERRKYDNIFVVRVEKAEKIPETHLTLCQINDGGPELIQVVCGAPNVREGMLAVWLKPGAIVPASVHEDAPFVIGKRKMLGKYDSCGMLAGADELDFGGKHDKIAEIDPEMARPGDLLADVFGLSDLILEIENKSLTHRPDTFGIIGFAREVAGILGVEFSEPDFLLRENQAIEGSGIKIIITDSEICSRYSCAVLRINESVLYDKYLLKMQTLISKSGMQRVSRIVDITNYLMLLTGQPLHAFDFDKFVAVGKSEEPKIVIRTAREGEKIELLDGKIIECNNNDILITSNDVPVALAGAMGGKSTEVDDETKNILLESATFSLYNLRKTQMEHGIFTEAITRFTKGVPAGGTLSVLDEAVKELNAKPFEYMDVVAKPIENNVVKITTDEINRLLGTDYATELIVKTLENVSFAVKVNDDVLEVTAPYWRTDIHIVEDVIEEVGRLLGYDNIGLTLPFHQTATKNGLFELKAEIRDKLASYGANEVLTYSFVSEKLLEKAGQEPKNSYRIVNSISPELQYIRQSVVPSLLEKAFLNEKLPVEKFAIFEMNKVYQKEWGLQSDNVPVEKDFLGFLVAERKGTGTAFYRAKKYVAKIFADFNIDVEFLPIKNKNASSKPFEPKRTAEICLAGSPEVVFGVVGEFKNSVRNNFKLADYLAGFEVDLGLVLEYRSNKKKIKLGAKKTEDLTVATTKSYAETLEEVREKYPDAEISPLSIYRADGEEAKNISFRIQTF